MPVIIGETHYEKTQRDQRLIKYCGHPATYNISTRVAVVRRWNMTNHQKYQIRDKIKKNRTNHVVNIEYIFILLDTLDLSASLSWKIGPFETNALRDRVISIATPFVPFPSDTHCS